MSSYRLLRSNKESGPYSLNDLVKLGLKPYDLVWVDGRSAAWRYPSEISELKEFAPVVEEQPFDRFFKKPSEDQSKPREIQAPPKAEIPPQKTVSESFSAKNSYSENQRVADATPDKKYASQSSDTSSQSLQNTPKKKVFVSMPETTGFEPQHDAFQDKYEQYLPKEAPASIQPNVADENRYSAINIHEPEESALETKYTQSLDDIKEMYINTLVQRKTKNKRREIIKRYVKPALLPLILVAVGILIGYLITNRKPSLQASQSISKVVPVVTIPEKKQSTPDQSSEDPIDQNGLQQADKQNQNSVPAVDNPSKKDEKVIGPRNDNVSPRTRNDEQKPEGIAENNRHVQSGSSKTTDLVKDKSTYNPGSVSPVQKRDVQVDPNTGERKSVVRNDNDLPIPENGTRDNRENSKKQSHSERTFLDDDRKDIRDMVEVKANNYLRGTFGGIRGLELTIYNNSNYFLDEVSVELQIMKPSEQPLRTDIITFRNISANGVVTVKVPDSQRGIRVDYRITNVESKQWEKGTAGL